MTQIAPGSTTPGWDADPDYLLTLRLLISTCSQRPPRPLRFVFRYGVHRSLLIRSMVKCGPACEPVLKNKKSVRGLNDYRTPEQTAPYAKSNPPYLESNAISLCNSLCGFYRLTPLVRQF